MPVYLDYLVRRLLDAGGRLETGTVGSLPETVTTAPVTVSCTGLGARELVPDPQVTPTRGRGAGAGRPGPTRVRQTGLPGTASTSAGGCSCCGRRGSGRR